MEYLEMFIEPNQDKVNEISIRNNNNNEVNETVKEIISEVMKRNLITFNLIL